MRHPMTSSKYSGSTQAQTATNAFIEIMGVDRNLAGTLAIPCMKFEYERPTTSTGWTEKRSIQSKKRCVYI